MTSLSIHDALKIYPGGVRAVDQVSLEIASGEFVVLVGPSGCGKSTLLRMIAGLEEFTGGSLRIGGVDATHLPARDRDVAMVFQSYALYPHMDVRRNLAFGLLHRRRHRGLASILTTAGRRGRRAENAEIDRRVRHAASMLGLEALLDRRPAQLSGGQRQRVALGRALVREPRVFLLDEPLSNLDAKLRHEMRTELRILHRRLRATMVHVTHDQEEAMSLGDRIVVMAGGRVMQSGPPSEVYMAPANRFVAGFVGSPAMNFAEGTLRRDGPFVCFRRGDAKVMAPCSRAAGVPAGAEVPAVLGVRPEHLTLVPGHSGSRSADDRALETPAAGHAPVRESDEGMALPARVEAVENLGDRADVVVDSPLGRWIMRLAAAEAPREGSQVHIAPAADAVHFFRIGAEGERW